MMTRPVRALIVVVAVLAVGWGIYELVRLQDDAGEEPYATAAGPTRARQDARPTKRPTLEGRPRRQHRLIVDLWDWAKDLVGASDEGSDIRRAIRVEVVGEGPAAEPLAPVLIEVSGERGFTDAHGRHTFRMEA